MPDWLWDGSCVGVTEPVADCVVVGAWLAEGLDDGVPVRLWEQRCDADEVLVCEDVREDVVLGVCVEDAVADCDGVAVTLDVLEGDGLVVSVAVTLWDEVDVWVTLDDTL